jgi:hypothetical protein
MLYMISYESCKLVDQKFRCALKTKKEKIIMVQNVKSHRLDSFH